MQGKNSIDSLQKVLDRGFCLDVTRWSDEPIQAKDKVLYTDSVSGRSIIARAPLEYSTGLRELHSKRLFS